MTIEEMEPLIDQRGYKGLEVKMAKGHQVHFFIVGIEYAEKDDYHYGDIVVFDQDGKAWIVEDTRWQIGNSYNVREWPDNKLHFIYYRLYNPAIPLGERNWRSAIRKRSLDLI